MDNKRKICSLSFIWKDNILPNICGDRPRVLRILFHKTDILSEITLRNGII
jgi:hypothetical protein